MQDRETVIVGAGVSGLSCARALANRGGRPLVLERARGVGGRCATRRVEDQPVDHGLAFLHGSARAFLQALREVGEATPVPGWPDRVAGAGSPCHPGSLHRDEFCMAFEEGVSAFPRHLARGLDVELDVDVTQVSPDGSGWEIVTERGRLHARTLVLALAVGQAVRLLEVPARSLPEVASTVGLLRMFGAIPCLTLLAGYESGCPTPPWDLMLPGGAGPVQLISHDSSKRRNPSHLVLVAQARAHWSRGHLEERPEEWGRALLEETARVVGPWAKEPSWSQFHRWGQARVAMDTQLTRPILIRTPSGSRLGLAGEVFSPGGGVQAAWQSGAELARRLLSEEDHESVR